MDNTNPLRVFWSKPLYRYIAYGLLALIILANLVTSFQSDKQIRQKAEEAKQKIEQGAPKPGESTGATPTAPSSNQKDNNPLSAIKNLFKPNTPLTINSTAVTMVKKTSGRCEALAPNDWAIVSDQETGMSAGLSSPDLTTFASWMVPWSIASAFPQDRNEDYFLRLSLCMNNLSDKYGSGWLVPCRENYGVVNLSSNVQSLTNGYKMREFTAPNNALKKNLKGVLVYKNFSAGDIILYIFRVAATLPELWDQKGGIALSSAISLRCTTTLGAGTTYQSTTEKKDTKTDLSADWEGATMGFENVYSPTTGDHYTAPLNSYWPTGPQGGGYYRELPGGGGYEKLQAGYGGY